MSNALRKWLILTSVFLKVTVGSLLSMKIGGKENKWAGIFIVILVGVCIIPVLWIGYNLFEPIFTLFAQGGHLHVGVGLTLNITAITIFLFSLMAAPALFYFSKDVEYLLPLPIKPELIIGAKFTMALLFEYLVALAFMIPIFFALIPLVSTGELAINTIITLLTLPIVPLIYSTVFTMLLVRISRFGRNPDRYTMFVGLVGMFLAVGFTLIFNNIVMIDPESVVNMLMDEPAVFDTLNWVFLNNSFAANALAGDNSWLVNQAINISITFVWIIIFFILARILYFKGVVGLSESGSTAKKMTADDIAGSTQKSSVFFSYLRKELRLLFRSPTAFMNCVLGVFIIPIIIVASIVIPMTADTGAGNAFSELFAMIDFTDDIVVAFFLLGMSVLGFFISSSVTVTATTISREGRNYFIMKYLPVSYRIQLHAKAASGMIIALLGLVCIIIPLQVFLRVPIHIFIAGILLTLPGAIILNYLGLLIDVTKPKLDWDNEQAAVKHNMNAVIPMFGGWGIAIGIGAFGFFLIRMELAPIIIFAVLFGLSSLVAAIIYMVTMSRGKVLLQNM